MYCPGVVPNVRSIKLFSCHLSDTDSNPPRCDADHKNLNQEASQRLRTWTEGWVEGLDLGTLWEDYGIVGDIMPFTNDFPRADIHKMISEARANAILDQVDRR
ncbi:hypothetical protein QCA50_020538 [Cerrena zonata]